MQNNNSRPWHYLFRRAKLLCVVSLMAYANVCPLSADAAMLSGNVSFDSDSGLYTYSYVLDNTAGLAAIKELSVLVDGSQDKLTQTPLSHTSPSAWSLREAVSGSSADSPLNEFGTFWQWYAGPALSIGETMSGFSFTTSVAPVIGSANNYFLWSNSYTGGPSGIGNGGIVEWGHIVAPDFGAAVAPVPVPAAVWLFGSGLAGLFGLASRRHAKTA